MNSLCSSEKPALRRLLLLLALAIWLFPSNALAQRQPPRELEATARRFAKAFEKKDWPRAMKLGRQLVELSPQDHVLPYNLACACALGGEEEQALFWLDRAAEKGFSDPEGMETDEDLAALRGEPDFAAALEKVRANERRARELFREMAADSRPLVAVPEGSGPHPVLVLLHGFGDSSPRFGRFFEEFGRREGLLLVAPTSVIPTPNGGFEWGHPADARWLVERALAAVEKEYAVDPRRIYLLGFSQGGRMAFEVGLGLPDRFAGVIAVGTRPSRRALDRARELGVQAPPFFLMAGNDEPAGAATREAARVLEMAGLEVRYQIYPNVGHHFPTVWQREIKKAISFFESSKEGP
ncbi:MAG: dienelactone hydrolase family protein [Acidobacteria bacterium]|nr:dienelactone hydrolase family protein [Acidobacteriota bacterium]